MAAQPRFFIVRPDTKQVAADGKTYTAPGAIVPLVAVDELPEWLDIPSAPRRLSVEQTVGLCNVGIASKSKVPYAAKIIHHATPAARRRFAAAKNVEAGPNNATAAPVAQPPSLASDSASNDRKTTATAVATPAAHRVDRIQAHRDEAHTGAASTSTTTVSVHSSQQSPPPQTQPRHPATANTSATPANNTTITASSSTTTDYCRHWCHYGTCKWGLRCRYLHAMPTTAAGLAAIGLREVPAWWVASAAGVGGNTTQGTRLRLHQHRQQHQDHHHQQHQHKQQQQEHRQQHPHQLQHAQQARHHHRTIDSGHHSQPHNHNPSGPGAATAGSGTGSDGALDPRDIRFAAARQLAPLLRRAQDHAHSHAHVRAGDIAGGAGASGASSGGGGAVAVGGRNKSRRAQLRETVALLRELGLGTDDSYARPRQRSRRREINPLQRVGGKGVANKGAVLRGAGADLVAASASAAAATATGAAGEMRDGLAGGAGPGSVQGDAVDGGGEEVKRVPGGIVQPVVVAENFDKLVDV